MAEQVYFENIHEGSPVTTLERMPTTRMLVMYAGASGDFYELHYDKDFAAKLGFPKVVVHGRLQAALLAKMLSDWAGQHGSLRRLSVQYRGNAFAGDRLFCKGKVSRKYDDKGDHCAECDVWVENQDGQITTRGSAVVVLPARATSGR